MDDSLGDADWKEVIVCAFCNHRFTKEFEDCVCGFCGCCIVCERGIEDWETLPTYPLLNDTFMACCDGCYRDFSR